ncbi:MAG: hypothetical protein Kow0079_08560 [Vicingaceae bacterium]
MRTFIIYLFTLISYYGFSQTVLERQVIGATGNFSTGTNSNISSTTGEAVVFTGTAPSLIVTSGFQQPNFSIMAPLGATYDIQNETCTGAKNGSIEIINISGCVGPYIITWNSDTTTLNQTSLDSLSAGSYYVYIESFNGCYITDTLTVGLDSEKDCELIFYSGLTPNGDGNNDVWIIENIEMFPENKVTIFNRWGNVVWEGENYDNVNVLWEGKSSDGVDLPDGTYFYVATVNDKTYKNWVEITR